MTRHVRLLALLGGVLLLVLVPTTARAALPGVNLAGAPTPDRVQRALATGAKQVRIFAYWNDFQPDGPGELAGPIDTFRNAVAQLNAGGAQPIFVVLGAPSWANGSSDPLVHPRDPADYGRFLALFAQSLGRYGTVAAYEIWNEVDGSDFWHPQPDAAQYTALLKAAYAAAKPVTTAAIITGASSNPDWLEALYDDGAQGSFDGIAVHTDTGCLTAGPDQFYRDPLGRLGQFTFLGYRELRKVELAHSDDKPIWMTELGWSSTGGSPDSCTRGASAGKKPDGVTRAQQAAFLTHAYQCLANDPYVVDGTWFTLSDTGGSPAELGDYGLLDVNGAPKPSYAAFTAVAKAGGGAAGPCGDFDAPSLTVTRPTEGEQFVDKLDLSATANDHGGVGVGRITFTYDGGNPIRNFTDGASAALLPWQGSGQLGLGPHTIEATALDRNGNTVTKVVHVTKVAVGALPSTLVTTARVATRVSCRKRSCAFGGRFMPVAGGASVGGKVAVSWEWFNKAARFRRHPWRKLIGGTQPASKRFAFTARLPKTGLWRVRVTYLGLAPYRAQASRFVSFRVR